VVDSALRPNPERTAWTVLLGSFVVFVLLTSSVAFGGTYWLRNASVNQGIVPVYSGTVLVTQPGRAAPEANLAEIPVGAIIVTEANGQASLTFTSARDGGALATVQVFGNSRVEIVRADSPRFGSGVNPSRVILRVTSGRVRAFVAVETGRPVEIELRSDPGAVTRLTRPGSNAEVEATFTESMVTVREGEATVSAHGQTVTLAKDERAQVEAEAPPRGPLDAERNLIRNGDFGSALDGDWALDVRPPLDPNEEPGTVELVTMAGRRTTRFQRTGNNWGQVGIVQSIERDVQGYAALRLHMDVMLGAQDLRNCGAQGTECPLIAKITFVDIYGNTQEWLQGFYYFYDPSPSAGSTLCVSCWPRQWPHEQWPRGKWQLYDSPNLLDLFDANGTPAATVRSISIYASGHSFQSFVTDVQLLAE
jgi:hypothetical protein